MTWILLVGFTAAFQGSDMQPLPFESERLCQEAKAQIEDEWGAKAICLQVAGE